ncbi:glycoside hydrolase family 3 protein [Cucurbitaria berberidis CBS 394.84]|uniref:beta-glucosidase n=1 Tax=Cucurbitaria berberidis CBS 394.84 TaxID=1168544 RepID=A0A9P4GKY1_9PLEO|nr:glycoside hydrolase family 3 protein [Cucurbitaria berberidis CBS 394.84]KAF1848238.1 glycoside hydrolase family 3 protein [Cucurbitaria berberidis CBS 394.84]
MAQTGDKNGTDDLRHLLDQMSLEEKITMLAGKNVWETPEIDRLGIPSLKVSDGPNGARGGSFFDGTTAACFPASVSLAATFNPDLSRQVGKALGQEAITKGAYVLLGPTVCCHRSPLGGRNFEAFSEDPHLSGVLASEYVKGLQEERVAATVKHFLANEQDTRRFSINQTISERALREIYLRPFEMVVKEADPWCFMSSYPKINGKHVDAQPKFLDTILRKEWNYEGLAFSDWGAASTVESVKYGLDLEMPGPPRFRTPEAVNKALKSEAISESDIDARVLSTLELLKKVGKFDDRKTTPEEEAIDRPEHRALIRKAGGEGIVLLKNEGNILPIDVKKTKKIALLGPLAKYAAAHGGGSASLNCHYKVTPYDAFTRRLGEQVEITHSKGAHIFRVYPDLETGCINARGNPGFLAEYFMTPTTTNVPFLVEEFPRSSFTTLMNTRVTGCQTVRFGTNYRPSVSGSHYLSFSGLGPSKLFINDELAVEQTEPCSDAMGFLLGVQKEVRVRFKFEAGKEYRVVIETHPSPVSNAEIYLLDNQCSIHLGFIAQEEMEQDVLAEAVSLAQEADLAIVFVGNTTQWETEGQDLESMTLPADGSQDHLIARVAAANPNTIVVNTTGVPVELPWLDAVPALVQAWYAGQETGNAILDVLLGETCPSGKLPISWPKKYEHTGCYGNFGLDSFESRKVEYVEGVFVGYRWFDKFWGQEQEVRFPFGFGLSYTSFEIKDAVVEGSISSDPIAKVKITAKVRNTGTIAGAETVQAYLAPPVVDGFARPTKALVGFAKVELQPSEEREVQIEFGRSDAAYWDEGSDKWRVTEGAYEVLIATSSHPEDIKVRLATAVKGGFVFAA